MDSFRNYIERMLQLIIFYILLHTAASAMQYGRERDLADPPEFSNYARQSKLRKYDQILSNLHSLFKERTSDHNDNNESGDDYNDFNYNHNNNDKQQFDEVLTEVTSALDNIKEELIKFNNEGLLTVEAPAVKHDRRHKRDVTNDTVTNATLTEKNATVTFTTTAEPATVTEKLEVLRVRNETVDTEVLRANNDTETAVSGRRMIPMMGPLPSPMRAAPPSPMRAAPPEYVTTTSRVKDKLLSYLEDIFNEVEKNIKPLTNIKIALSNDNHYRIGYIIATIDTLEVNLKKLKNDMNLHQQFWDDEKILDLFDRIKATNTVATSLIESLKKYLPRS